MVGWISDKLFGSRRGPPISLFLILSLLSVALTSLFSSNKSSYVLDCALLLVNGYSIYGPQVLVRERERKREREQEKESPATHTDEDNERQREGLERNRER